MPYVQDAQTWKMENTDYNVKTIPQEKSDSNQSLMPQPQTIIHTSSQLFYKLRMTTLNKFTTLQT